MIDDESIPTPSATKTSAALGRPEVVRHFDTIHDALPGVAFLPIVTSKAVTTQPLCGHFQEDHVRLLATVMALKVSLPAVAHAQAERMSDKDVKALMDTIHDRRDRFEDALDGEFKHSVLQNNVLTCAIGIVRTMPPARRSPPSCARDPPSSGTCGSRGPA